MKMGGSTTKTLCIKTLPNKNKIEEQNYFKYKPDTVGRGGGSEIKSVYTFVYCLVTQIHWAMSGMGSAFARLIWFMLMIFHFYQYLFLGFRKFG